ncbi:hypothetical protein GJ744_006864 [Endocarpon pusillum]|uniref:Uncharacterized protein n=1 Tax=Endocarpon pusillum TaxID=364733 RepID=A0A8H7AJP9_9EURO|nr:hypothetical protein GJ744_006864 [Endocarpon pusillum]
MNHEANDLRNQSTVYLDIHGVMVVAGMKASPEYHKKDYMYSYILLVKITKTTKLQATQILDGDMKDTNDELTNVAEYGRRTPAKLPFMPVRCIIASLLRVFSHPSRSVMS